ncbi:hypothetical protein H3V53_14895 [Paraburkholderia bengalensis]|uniref:Uncharacterized protein n=1 Tax=Paraburkholderia bengalensis TaxID=2747562 RepID=A0ABU8IS31_9BURK
MGAFRVVVGMWIAPDLAAVRRVSDDSRALNHDHFDAAAIAQALEEFNPCGERIRIRFADDTIDLATARARVNGMLSGPPDCRDFAQAVLAAASRSRGPVIKVREQWATLRARKAEALAAPPGLLMFALYGTFDSTMIWLQQFQMRLRIRAADPMHLMLDGPGKADLQGVLPTELSALFEAHFGFPYLPDCLVARLAHSQLPDWMHRQVQ